MNKGQSTREAIVGEALSQAVHVGLEGLSLGVLASSLDLSKSGLFAHFKSKEMLQLAVLDEAIARFQDRVTTPALATANGKPRLEALFKNYLGWIKGQSDLGGCPFMVIAQEIGEAPKAVRERFLQSQDAWRMFLASTAAAAVKKRELHADPEQFAFEFAGIALAYQQALKLMEPRAALKRATAAFDALLARRK